MSAARSSRRTQSKPKGKARPNSGSSSAKAASRRPKSRARRSPRRKPLSKWILAAGAAVAALLCGACLLWIWGVSGDQDPEAIASQSSEQFVRFELGTALDTAAVAAALEAAGLLDDPSRFSWYKRLYHPLSTFESGVHLLPRGASAKSYVQLLARLHGRPERRVTIPEGWDTFQIAARLEQEGICGAAEFQRLALSAPEADDEPGSTQQNPKIQSHEGWLYPASYDLRVNTSAHSVIRRMHSQAKTRFAALFSKEATALKRLHDAFGFSQFDVLTLASVVQKEAADAGEFGAIASVFFNRLSDERFRPRRMLQSDPTAAYGCKLPDAPPSCAAYSGRVTPGMLRDPANRYNTYHNPGLPPGPIGNPSIDAIRAVLHPPSTTYYFFVAPNGGRHTFSRTLEEHQSAIKSAK